MKTTKLQNHNSKPVHVNKSTQEQIPYCQQKKDKANRRCIQTMKPTHSASWCLSWKSPSSTLEEIRTTHSNTDLGHPDKTVDMDMHSGLQASLEVTPPKHEFLMKICSVHPLRTTEQNKSEIKGFARSLYKTCQFLARAQEL